MTTLTLMKKSNQNASVNTRLRPDK